MELPTQFLRYMCIEVWPSRNKWGFISGQLCTFRTCVSILIVGSEDTSESSAVCFIVCWIVTTEHARTSDCFSNYISFKNNFLHLIWKLLTSSRIYCLSSKPLNKNDIKANIKLGFKLFYFNNLHLNLKLIRKENYSSEIMRTLCSFQ